MADTAEWRLQGAPNFRDLGGYRSADGRRVARQRLFRSGNLARLTTEDFDTLRRIPMRTVVDLRSELEAQHYPSRLPDELGIDMVSVVTNPYARAGGGEYKQILLDDPTPRGAFKTIEATYLLLPEACGAGLKKMVDCIAEDSAPVAFHCSNGRDRTGVISMLLLHMLGVSQEDIVSDYLESNVRIDIEAAVRLSLDMFTKEYGVAFDDATLRTMNQALEPNVGITFATIDRDYGSTQQYLQAFGITPELQEAFREKMLEEI